MSIKIRQTIEENYNYTVIICCFNPLQDVFLRALSAIKNLMNPKNSTIEYIIVDNNSNPPLQKLSYFTEFLEKFSFAKIKILHEVQQGLTFARVTAIKQSSASILIFFDDDNEPAMDYLIAVQECLVKYPGVAAWGPGDLTVEFLGAVSPRFDRNCRSLFQERHELRERFSCRPETWCDDYPYGTGLVLRRWVCDRYVEAITSGELSACGRAGTRMTSADDIQLVWEAIKGGFSAGVSPKLKLTHLIPEKRSNIVYAKKLAFGTASSYIPALVESFPESRETALQLPSNLRIILGLLKRIIKQVIYLRLIMIPIEIAGYLGHYIGILKLTHSHRKQWLLTLVKWLGLE